MSGTSTVPRLYYGLARQLRDQLTGTIDANEAALASITKPLKERWTLRPGHKVRMEHLEQAAQQWRQLPAFGRLGVPRVELKKHSLAAAEVRLLTGDLRFDSWSDGPNEQSIAAEVLTLICNPKRFSCHIEPLAIFSLHSLARRFERGTRDVDAVLLDMTAVVQQHGKIVQAGGSGFQINTPNGDCWVGDLVTASFGGTEQQRPETKMLAVRTFLVAGFRWGIGF